MVEFSIDKVYTNGCVILNKKHFAWDLLNIEKPPRPMGSLWFFCYNFRSGKESIMAHLDRVGRILRWSFKKRKKNSITFVGSLFANNIYLKQI
jgi:hypothetical protein